METKGWLSHTATGVAGIAIGWLFLPMPLTICGSYSSVAAPAWVQAVGSILAIAATALVAAWQLRHQRLQAERAVKQRMRVTHQRLASGLSATIRVSTDTAAVLRGLRTGASESDINNAIDRTLNFFSLSFLNLDELHELPEDVTKPITDLLAEHDQFDVELRAIYNMQERARIENFPLSRESFITHIESMEQYASIASLRLLAILEKNGNTP